MIDFIIWFISVFLTLIVVSFSMGPTFCLNLYVFEKLLSTMKCSLYF